MDLNAYISERRKERPLYMPYLTAGDPNLEATVRFASAMVKAGADIIELGFPFSDPTADGPVIQAAMVRAMESPDFSLAGVFRTAGAIHAAHPNVPMVLLTYMNPVMNGMPGDTPKARAESFLRACRDAGIAGLVIPDLPFEAPEAGILRELSAPLGVSQVAMVAPNTRKERMKAMRGQAGGFIYYVTSYGVTGARRDLPEDLVARARGASELIGLPVFAGFGISDPVQLAALRGIDGVIVGSLNHSIIEKAKAGAEEELRRTTAAFVAALSAIAG